MAEATEDVPDFYEAVAAHRAAEAEAIAFIACWLPKLACEGLTLENQVALAQAEAALSPLALCYKQRLDPRRQATIRGLSFETTKMGGAG